MSLPPPINFMSWINEHRHLLKPPVGNQEVWKDRDFMVTVVGGPNSRQDFHINQGEEFFYQLEGEMNLRHIDEHGKVVNFPIKAGEIFLLPGNVPHSPQRPAGSVGVVIERRRDPGEKDGFLWVCKSCGKELYRESVAVTDLVKDLPPVFDRFYGNPAHTVCKSCGTDHPRPKSASL